MAFYQAFEAKDVDAMMATWAEDEELVCIHPGGPRLVGYEAVRAGWEQLFASDTKPRGAAIVTNVFLRTPSGWRMVMHHSSPAPAIAAIQPAGPLH